MRRIIIAIHGLGNKPKPQLLRPWWKKALREGLIHSGFRVRFLRFNLVCWSDTIYPHPLSRNVRDDENPLYLAEPYLQRSQRQSGWRNSVRSRLYKSLELGLEKAYASNRIAGGLEAISNHFIRRYFADLDTYYSKDRKSRIEPDLSVHDAIQLRLYTVLKRYRGRRILLIAHSMGSIVAFDVLNRYASELNIDTLVTIGSPLGLPNVKRQVFRVQKSFDSGIRIPQTPKNVLNKWYNLSDPEDKVAIDQNLVDDYLPNHRNVGVVDKTVFNDYGSGNARNPHKSYGYLRTPEMAGIVAEFLGKTRS